jgi:uncharacterized protein YfbU (UPF0304 family)
MRMTIKKILLLAVAATMLLGLGCFDMLNQQIQKDKNLAHVVHENLSTLPEFQANFISFEYLKAEEYMVNTQGLVDPHEAGVFGYNSMVYLLERNDTLVKTGRTSFRIYGHQDGAEIFKVIYTGTGVPRVDLKGCFEGEEYP